MTGDLYSVPVVVVRDSDPRMRDTPPGLVACDGVRLLVRESDWPAVSEVLMRHRSAQEIASEAIGRAMR